MCQPAVRRREQISEWAERTAWSKTEVLWVESTRRAGTIFFRRKRATLMTRSVTAKVGSWRTSKSDGYSVILSENEERKDRALTFSSRRSTAANQLSGSQSIELDVSVRPRQSSNRLSILTVLVSVGRSLRLRHLMACKSCSIECPTRRSP